MAKSIRWQTITKVVFVFFYLAMAAAVLILLDSDFSREHTFLGTLVLIGSIPHIAIYFINHGYQSKGKSPYLIVGIVGFVLGLIFVFSDNITVDQICLYWGILDIVRGSVEIADTFPKIKDDKLELIEIGISTGDIAIGALLCIHLASGIRLHLIYFSIAFILYAVKIVTEYIISRRKHE